MFSRSSLLVCLLLLIYSAPVFNPRHKTRCMVILLINGWKQSGGANILVLLPFFCSYWPCFDIMVGQNFVILPSTSVRRGTVALYWIWTPYWTDHGWKSVWFNNSSAEGRSTVGGNSRNMHQREGSSRKGKGGDFIVYRSELSLCANVDILENNFNLLAASAK